MRSRASCCLPASWRLRWAAPPRSRTARPSSTRSLETWSNASSGRAGFWFATTTTTSARPSPTYSARTTATPSSATVAPTRSTSSGGIAVACARGNAVVRHPVTGRRCWFNQIAFLNEWTLAPEVREYLVDVYGPDGQPFNTRFGDGDPIGEDVVQLLNQVY